MAIKVDRDYTYPDEATGEVVENVDLLGVYFNFPVTLTYTSSTKQTLATKGSAASTEIPHVIYPFRKTAEALWTKSGEFDLIAGATDDDRTVQSLRVDVPLALSGSSCAVNLRVKAQIYNKSTGEWIDAYSTWRSVTLSTTVRRAAFAIDISPWTGFDLFQMDNMKIFVENEAYSKTSYNILLQPSNNSTMCLICYANTRIKKYGRATAVIGGKEKSCWLKYYDGAEMRKAVAMVYRDGTWYFCDRVE